MFEDNLNQKNRQKMGKRQSQFKEITHKRFTAYKHDKLTLKELENSELIRFVSDTYKKLGGQLHTLPINYGSWDISTKDFIIELDEERHFNRYRLETLNSKFYNNYKGFSVTNYKNYCKDYECRCLKAANWGNNWKNDSTEKMVSITGISSLACGSNYGECYTSVDAHLPTRPSGSNSRACGDSLWGIVGSPPKLPKTSLSPISQQKNILTCC